MAILDILKKAAPAVTPFNPITSAFITSQNLLNLLNKKQPKNTINQTLNTPNQSIQQNQSRQLNQSIQSIQPNQSLVSKPVVKPPILVQPKPVVQAQVNPINTLLAGVSPTQPAQAVVPPVIPMYRPPTPAPTMLKEAETKPLTDDELQMSVIKKSLKQQYGDSLTDDEANFIAKQQIAAAKQPTNYLTDFEAATKAQLEKLTGITKQQQEDYEKKKAELEATNQKVMAQFKLAEEAKAKENIEQARAFGAETEAVQERFLGAKGNLTSTVGTQAIGAIKAQTNATINAINAAKNAAIELKQAELQGASDETLEALSKNLQTTKQAEAAAILEAETNLQNAKLQAIQAGDEAKLNLLQSALDQLSVDKVKNKADATLTKNIGDGYVYDEFGQKITDAEGNFITYDSPEELQDFITLKEGDTLIDPKTGLPVFQSPKTEKPQYQKIGDTTYQVGVDGNLMPVQTSIAPQEQAKAITQAKQKVNLIDEILSDPNLNAVVGLKGPSAFVPGTKAQAVKNKINQLVGDLVLDERGKLKGSGAISDFETKIIKQSATNLGTNLSNEDFKAALQNLKSKFNNVETAAYLSQATGVSQDEAAQLLEEIKLQQGSYPTLEEIKQTYPSFNQPLSMGENGSEVGKIASAIGQFESGGNYKARGPVVTSGQYKGERALGKYQIMPGNLPSWSKEALGRVVSEQEFLNNPQIQDQIAQYKMGKIYEQHGTVEDVASVWFSGRPLAKAGNAKDVIGTSVPKYVKNVQAIYNGLT